MASNSTNDSKLMLNQCYDYENVLPYKGSLAPGSLRTPAKYTHPNSWT